MSKRRLKIIFIGVLAAAALTVTWNTVSAFRGVSMTVRGFTTKQWDEDLAQQMSSREYIVAAIELTNGGRRPIAFLGRHGTPYYYYALRTPNGWKGANGGCGFCRIGLEQYVLQPSQAITFEALVPPGKPVKVALNYSDGRKMSPVWRWLPQWLRRRWPGGGESETVSTDVIDLSGAVGLTANPLTGP